MVGNVSNNQNTVNTNNTTDQTTKVHRHTHRYKANESEKNTSQKPDAVSGATKKNGGDHYFETRA